MENVSFVVVVIGGTQVEATQYWNVEASRKFDCIADAVAAFSDKHDEVIERVVVRPTNG